jgi:hypothetical protein
MRLVAVCYVSRVIRSFFHEVAPGSQKELAYLVYTAIHYYSHRTSLVQA